eukprot:315697-Amphidinium_carterae.1
MHCSFDSLLWRASSPSLRPWRLVVLAATNHGTSKSLLHYIFLYAPKLFYGDDLVLVPGSEMIVSTIQAKRLNEDSQAVAFPDGCHLHDLRGQKQSDSLLPRQGSEKYRHETATNAENKQNNHSYHSEPKHAKESNTKFPNGNPPK